jgi:nitric oxide reductase subunit B
MWGTGIVFMIYHFSEAHFWLIPHFRENFIRDITVQWKSYGSFVGSWNMLLYGTAIFLMAKIKGDDDVGRGKKAFFFYFLGLTNLMLGWAHHTYFIPTQPWVRYLAYGVSMTEWIILISIIMSWKKSLTQEKLNTNQFAYKFLMSMDFWVFFNLIMALLISIPFINFYTHGTHITVAHSMGTTIGINTSILLASLIFIATRTNESIMQKSTALLYKGYLVFNISLAVFLISLLLGGIKKSVWLFFTANPSSFGEMHESLHPFMLVFLFAGIGVFIGLIMIAIPILKVFFNRLKTN